MTTNLVKNCNLLQFDHIIFLANHHLQHCNFVVIFPKAKTIELMDSFPGYFDAKILTAAWYWMVLAMPSLLKDGIYWIHKKHS